MENFMLEYKIWPIGEIKFQYMGIQEKQMKLLNDQEHRH